MDTTDDFQTVFVDLKRILQRHEPSMIVISDSDNEYYLNTKHVLKNKKPLFFGSVSIRKSYVSFHLMPLYNYPDLLLDISPGLEARMQGKSCFNFRAGDPELLEELDALTTAGCERYRQNNQI